MSKAFTLIELLIVVLIIMITATLSVPAIDAWVGQYKIKQQVYGFLNDVQNARTIAMRSSANEQVSIYFPDTSSYQVIVNNRGWCTQNAITNSATPGVTLLKQYNAISSGNTFATTPSFFTFSSSGMIKGADCAAITKIASVCSSGAMISFRAEFLLTTTFANAFHWFVEVSESKYYICFQDVINGPYNLYEESQ